MMDTHGFTDKKRGLLEADLTYKIRGALYRVANKYGKGLKETIYQKALIEEFRSANIAFEEQKRISIFSLDTAKVLGVYIPDFVIENKVILELKSTDFTARKDIEQQRSYLRASDLEISLLVNFGAPKLEIMRSIHTNDRKPFITQLKHP